MANLENACQCLTCTETSAEQLLQNWKEHDLEQWKAASLLWFCSVLNSECKKNNVEISSDCDSNWLENRLEKVIAQGLESGYFSDGCLKECFEMESLETIGLLSSSTQWTRRAIRTNTRLFYTQEKFNLLREETEGFAKLITDLLSFHKSWDLMTIQRSRLVSLVGCFDLDPNRVIDLIWNASAFRDESSGELLSLLSAFRSDYISQILGFKFQNCIWNKAGAVGEEGEALESIFSPISIENSFVPSSEIFPLVEVAAEALNRQLIRLCDIWPHLSPEDPLHFTKMLEFNELVEKHTSEFGVVSLSGGESNASSRTHRTDLNVYEDLEQGPFTEGLFPKVELVCALLERGSWEVFMDCMKIWMSSEKIVDFGQQLCSHPRYRSILISIAERVLEKFLGKVLLLSNSSSRDSSFIKMSDERLMNLFGLQSLEDLVYYKGGQQRYHLIVYILLSLGPYAKQSSRCLFFLCRFVQKLLSGGCQLRNLGLKLLIEVIFPATSCIKGNSALFLELWRTVCILPFNERYQVYYLVRHSIKQEYNIVRRANSWINFETRRVLRRLAKENVKQFGRWLGKICNGNPLVAAECILEQVQSYENLIPVLVDALKYMTPLTFDVIMYCCLEQLDSCNKDKIKSDGMNLSQWYYGLCIFISGLIRKYFAVIDCRGLFHFIFNKLEEGDAVYIFLLLEILSRVSGGANTEHLSDSQISSLGGGPLLREIVTLASSSLSETKKASRKAAQMIRNVVSSEGLIADLAILVAQQKESVLYDPAYREIPLRMVCNIFDKCQEALILYTELILGEEKYYSTSSGFSENVESRFHDVAEVKSEISNFPSFESLLVDYHLSYDSAFLFMRPFLKFERIFEVSSDASNTFNAPFHISCLTRVMSDNIWKATTPELFAIFWTLKLYDIYVPVESYRTELQRLGSLAHAEQDTESDLHSLSRDIKENRKHRQDGRKVEEIISLLEEEMQTHEKHYQRMQNLLREKKLALFQQTTNLKLWPILFLQMCLIPRCISSFNDAAFCSKFIQVLLDLNPPGLRILPLFHYLLVNIGQISQCLTEAEATRFGNFVADVLKLLNKWWMSEDKYNAECSNRKAFSLQMNEEDTGGISYSEFVVWNRRVHLIITNSMLSNLSSENYLDIRNSIEILSRVVKHFPRMESHGILIQKKLEEVLENKNELFKVVASRYLSLLQNERSKWISADQMHSTDSVQLKGDLLDATFLQGTHRLPKSDISTSTVEQIQVIVEEREQVSANEDTTQNENIATSHECPSKVQDDEQLQAASTDLEQSQALEEKMDLSHTADPTHAELARIQAAVAEKRQLLQKEREKRSRLSEQNTKEEVTSKSGTKEILEPGEITKSGNRSNYKKETSSSRNSSNEDAEARKRRRDLSVEEADGDTEANRRSKREKSDATSYSRNDVKTRTRDALNSGRSYSPSTRSYSNAGGEANRNRNQRSSYSSQERIFRDNESLSSKSRRSSSEQRERKLEDSEDREEYTSARSSNRSRKGRK